MDAQFSLTRTWLVFILLYNAAQLLHAGANVVLFSVYDSAVDAMEDSDLKDAQAKRDEVSGILKFIRLTAIGSAVARAASVAVVIWLFWWKKLAFWCYSISVAVNFVFGLWLGESFFVAGIDIVGLAGLVALMLRIEPGSWELLG